MMNKQDTSQWKENFISAIRDKNINKLEELIEIGNQHFFEEFIHHSYVDDNLKFHADHKVLSALFEKSKKILCQ